MNKITDVLGVKVSAINYEIALKKISHLIKTNQKKMICVSAVHLIIECQNNPKLMKGVNKSALVTPDGMPLVWLSKLSGKNWVSRVYGPDLSLKVCALAKIKNYKVFLLGGSKGQSEQLKNVLEKKFPGIKIVGAIDTPQRPISQKQNKLNIKQINDTKANILFVGLGCPYQELWMIENRFLLNTNVLIGVGAAFDFITGKVKQAPKWMQNMGLEWLFRLIQEPRRLWKRYLILNFKFIIKNIIQY